MTRIPTAPSGALHLSPVRLAELVAGEDAAAEDHVRRCPRCRRELDRLRAEQREIAAAPLPDWLEAHAGVEIVGARGAPARPAPARRHRIWRAAGATVALAAALVLVWSIGREPPGAPSVRRKGRAIHVFIARGDQVREAREGDLVHPGDRVQLVYSGEAAFVALLSRDGSGAAAIYYPAGMAAAPVAAGVGVVLPSSAELDGVLGRERLFALVCDTAVALAPLRDRLQRGDDPPPPAGCRIERLDLVKVRGRDR